MTNGNNIIPRSLEAITSIYLLLHENVKLKEEQLKSF